MSKTDHEILSELTTWPKSLIDKFESDHFSIQTKVALSAMSAAREDEREQVNREWMDMLQTMYDEMGVKMGRDSLYWDEHFKKHELLEELLKIKPVILKKEIEVWIAGDEKRGGILTMWDSITNPVNPDCEWITWKGFGVIVHLLTSKQNYQELVEKRDKILNPLLLGYEPK